MHTHTTYKAPLEIITGLYSEQSPFLADIIEKNITEASPKNALSIELDIINTLTYPEDNMGTLRDLKLQLEDGIQAKQKRQVTKQLLQDASPSRILPMTQHQFITAEDIASVMQSQAPSDERQVEAFFNKWHPLMETFSQIIQKHTPFDAHWEQIFINKLSSDSPIASLITQSNGTIGIDAARNEYALSKMSAGIEALLFDVMLEKSAIQEENAHISKAFQDSLIQYFDEKQSNLLPRTTRISANNQKIEKTVFH